MEQMKNPLTEYIEKLKFRAAMDKQFAQDSAEGSNAAFYRGCRIVSEGTAKELESLLPRMENLVTWTDGAPTEPVVDQTEMYLVEFFFNGRLKIAYAPLTYFQDEEIRRHAKLHYGCEDDCTEIDEEKQNV